MDRTVYMQQSCVQGLQHSGIVLNCVSCNYMVPEMRISCFFTVFMFPAS